MPAYSKTKMPFVSLVLNMVYSAYHMIFGGITQSWWLLTIGTYYVILSILRFSVLSTKSTGPFIRIFTGVMLMVLSIPLAGIIILSHAKDRGTHFHLIPMLTIALHAFTKITLATINLIRARKQLMEKEVILRNISFADALFSILSLQRSMLVSFDGMTKTGIQAMNLATGSCVCVIVFFLGCNLIRTKKSPYD